MNSNKRKSVGRNLKRNLKINFTKQNFDKRNPEKEIPKIQLIPNLTYSYHSEHF